MAKRTSKQSSTLTTGFTLGNWDNTMEAIAEARNRLSPKAKKLANVVVETYTFNIHNIRGGKPSAKPVAVLELARSRAAVERAASEWAKANPGKPFTLVYEGSFNGTDCLPRYNNPKEKRDRIEGMVTFSVRVYDHSGTQGDVKTSDSERAASAVLAALEGQS